MPVSEILLLPHTHHDAGYTNSPRLLATQHVELVEHVLELVEADSNDGPEALRWTFEVARPVREYLRATGEVGRARIARLVALGRISVTGGPLNMTQLPGTAEVEASYRDLHEWREYGIDVRTEQHGDVNGLSWGTAGAMQAAGLSRLLMALNPDHGRAPFIQPSAFRWQMPDPSAEPLFVLLSTHYGVGEEWGIVDGREDIALSRIEAFVDGLDAREDWPYSVAVIHAGNDNRWPDDRLLRIVRAWNAMNPQRPMRTATVDQAMDTLEQEAAGFELPVVRGEWADWWAHGHGSSALEVSVYRSARQLAIASDHLRSLARLDPTGQPRTASVLGFRRGAPRIHDESWREHTRDRITNLLELFGEHTWGSWDSVADPDGWNSRSQWNAKEAQAWEAWELARILRTEALFEYSASRRDPATERTADSLPLGSDLTVPDGDILTVVNPSAQHRRELLRDDRGRTAVADIPPLAVTAVPVGPEATVTAGNRIVTDRYEILVDPARGGIVSWRDLHNGQELLDEGLPPLGALVDERFPADSGHPMFSHRKAFHPDTPGPVTDSVVITGATDDATVSSAGPTRELRWSTGDDELRADAVATVANGIDGLDLEIIVTKQKRRGPESVHISFPIAAIRPRFLLESEGAVFEADAEQLPDTARSWYSIQHAIGVESSDGTGMTIQSQDAPLVQLGRIRTTEWAVSLDKPAQLSGLVSSWVMNNLYFTNFKATQEGSATFRYRLVPGAPDRRSVRLAGHHAAHPLIARRILEPPHPTSTPPLTLSTTAGGSTEDILLELLPTTDGAVTAVLRSTIDLPTAVRLTHPGGKMEAIVPPLGRISLRIDTDAREPSDEC